MKALSLLMILAVFSGFGQSFNQVGDLSSFGSVSQSPVFKVAADGNPYLMVTKNNGINSTSVLMTYSGAQWDTLGDVFEGGSYASIDQMDFCIENSNSIYAAFYVYGSGGGRPLEGSQDQEVLFPEFVDSLYIYHWNGSQWNQIGLQGINGTQDYNSDNIPIKLEYLNNDVYLTFTPYSSGKPVVVKYDPGIDSFITPFSGDYTNSWTSYSLRQFELASSELLYVHSNMDSVFFTETSGGIYTNKDTITVANLDRVESIELPNGNVLSLYQMMGASLEYTVWDKNLSAFNTPLSLVSSLSNFMSYDADVLDTTIYVAANFSSQNYGIILYDMGMVPYDTLMDFMQPGVNYEPLVVSGGGKLYTYQSNDNGIFVYKLNSAPEVTAITGDTLLCNGDDLLLTVSFEDIDVSTFGFTVVSSDQSIFSDNGFTVQNTGLAYTVRATPSLVPVNSTVDLTISYTDGIISGMIDTVITVSVGIIPTVNAGNDTLICKNTSVQLPWVDANSQWINPNDAYSNGDNEVGPGWYVLYTKDPVTMCSNTDTMVVSEIAEPEVSFNVSESTCGNEDGAMSATIISGNAPFQTYWSTGDSSVTILTNVGSGIYYYFLEDQSGCKSTFTVSVPENSITIVVDDITNPSCWGANDGSISISAQGNGPFTYYWDYAGFVQNISNLPAGEYQVLVEDVNGCKSGEKFELTQDPKINVDYNILEADCSTPNGGIEGLITGSSAIDYEYLDKNNNVLSTNPDLLGVNAGYYKCVYNDQNNCRDTLDLIIPVTGGPSVLIDSAFNATCDEDGQIFTTIDTDNGISDISWNIGANTQDILELPAGYYYVRVTDTNGCANYQGIRIREKQPEKIEICLVSVDTILTQNIIVWERPISSEIDFFRIYRETNTFGEFIVVGETDYMNETIFFDTIAAPQYRSWRYRIAAVNFCGVESIWSDYHKTIHLNTKLEQTQVQLNWDDYEGFSYGSFIVRRYTDAAGWEEIATVNIDQLSYVDVIDPTTSGLDYVVEVEPGFVCSSTKARDHRRTRSNRSLGFMIPSPEDEEEDPTASTLNLQSTTSVYPNPVVNNMRVNVREKVTYKLYDLTGKVLLQGALNSGSTNLDLSFLSKGMYLLRVQGDSGVASFKVEKE